MTKQDNDRVYNEASAKVKRSVEESFKRHEADYKIKKDEDSAARLAKRILEELIENKVAIKFKEGILNIVLDEKNNIFMSGPVSEIKNIKSEI